MTAIPGAPASVGAMPCIARATHGVAPTGDRAGETPALPGLQPDTGDAGKLMVRWAEVSRKKPVILSSKTSVILEFAGFIILGLLLGFSAPAIPWWVVAVIVLGCWYVYARIRYRALFTASNLIAQGQYDDALALTEAYLSKDPGSVYARVTAAATCLGMGRNERALEYCNETLELEPRNAMALSNRACAWLNLNEPEKAIEDATRAIAINDFLVQAHVNRASGYLRLSKFKEALPDLNFALMLEQNNASALFNRAIAHYGMNKHDLSMKDLTSALTLARRFNPGLIPSLLVLKGTVHGSRHQQIEAKASYAEALAENPKLVGAFINQALCYSFEGELDKAVQNLDEAEGYEPTTAEQACILGYRARIALQQNNIDAALEYSQAAIDRCLVPQTMATRGIVLSRAGQQDEALAVLSKAIEIDPYDSEAYWFRHEVYEKLNDSAKAEKDKQVALKFGYHSYL